MYVMIWLCVVAIVAISCISLYAFEKQDRKAYQELVKKYRKLVNKLMDEIEIAVDLSESLQAECDGLKEDNEELGDILNDMDKEVEEKENRIKKLEEDNEKLCAQIRKLFDEKPETEG